MSDTAAFFANKKKKKKAPFKFNANLIDANTVLTEKVHVYVPPSPSPSPVHVCLLSTSQLV
jgi:hypothetical protein